MVFKWWDYGGFWAVNFICMFWFCYNELYYLHIFRSYSLRKQDHVLLSLVYIPIFPQMSSKNATEHKARKPDDTAFEGFLRAFCLLHSSIDPRGEMTWESPFSAPESSLLTLSKCRFFSWTRESLNCILLLSFLRQPEYLKPSTSFNYSYNVGP